MPALRSSNNTTILLLLLYQDTSELFFDNVRVSKEQVLGGEAGLNKGFYMLMQELPQERLLVADIGVSSAEAMFEWTKWVCYFYV